MMGRGSIGGCGGLEMTDDGLLMTDYGLIRHPSSVICNRS
jgi:hypothetical protein